MKNSIIIYYNVLSDAGVAMVVVLTLVVVVVVVVIVVVVAAVEDAVIIVVVAGVAWLDAFDVVSLPLSFLWLLAMWILKFF